MPYPTRSGRLDAALADLLAQAPEIEAASVVSFDGLPMASALPASMDEDRVAAMSAALLSLGERAAEGLGRGELSQVYIEGAEGTVFLVSAENEAVLVAVACRGAKVGMMMFEVRRAAAAVADALRVPASFMAGLGEAGLGEAGPVGGAAVPGAAVPDMSVPVLPMVPEPAVSSESFGTPTYRPPVSEPAPAYETFESPFYEPSATWSTPLGTEPPTEPIAWA